MAKNLLSVGGGGVEEPLSTGISTGVPRYPWALVPGPLGMLKSLVSLGTEFA
jgi:hypothetical protein